MTHPLDNPVFRSLNETHAHLAVSSGDTKFYHPDYCPFGGYINSDKISAAIDDYSKLTDNFFIVGDRPAYSGKLHLKNELVCLQMILEAPLQISITETIEPLNGKHEDELFNLVNLVQTGYFRQKTSALGNYSGIFINNQLVSVCGERMQTNQFTEVSAIVTHPDHTGKGFAKQLIAHTVNRIFDSCKTPFLHVAEKNTGAIILYQKLGFNIRRKISFWNFIQ